MVHHQHLVKPPSPSERQARFVEAWLDFRLFDHEHLPWTLPYGKKKTKTKKQRFNSLHHKHKVNFPKVEGNISTLLVNLRPCFFSSFLGSETELEDGASDLVLFDSCFLEDSLLSFSAGFFSSFLEEA